MPANVDGVAFSCPFSFDNSFWDTYENHGKAAATYIK